MAQESRTQWLARQPLFNTSEASVPAWEDEAITGRNKRRCTVQTPPCGTISTPSNPFSRAAKPYGMPMHGTANVAAYCSTPVMDELHWTLPVSAAKVQPEPQPRPVQRMHTKRMLHAAYPPGYLAPPQYVPYVPDEAVMCLPPSSKRAARRQGYTPSSGHHPMQHHQAQVAPWMHAAHSSGRGPMVRDPSACTDYSAKYPAIYQQPQGPLQAPGNAAGSIQAARNGVLRGPAAYPAASQPALPPVLDATESPASCGQGPASTEDCMTNVFDEDLDMEWMVGLRLASTPAASLAGLLAGDDKELMDDLHTLLED